MHATSKHAKPLQPQPPLEVIKAAKVVVALSGWAKLPDGREVYQSSYMAIAVLKRAIEEAENPQLILAPEPLPTGL